MSENEEREPDQNEENYPIEKKEEKCETKTETNPNCEDEMEVDS